jgi:hypothetical protein
MHHINWLAVIVAGIVGFFPGALWYSPVMFLKPWARELGIDLTQPQKPKHLPVMLLTGMILSIVAAAVLSLAIDPERGLHHALLAAFVCAVGLVGTSFGIQYLFEQRSLKFWAINAGYHVVQFLLIGLVLGLWQ